MHGFFNFQKVLFILLLAKHHWQAVQYVYNIECYIQVFMDGLI